jgi:PAS domain-containing protein
MTGSSLLRGAVPRDEKGDRVAIDYRLLVIVGLAEGIAIFDADDRLVLCNERYRAISAPGAKFLVPGARFEDLMRIGIRLGTFPAAAGNEDEWLRKRMADHARGGVSFERQTPDGGWLHVVEQSTRDGEVGCGTTVRITLPQNRN